ncbi:SulP family inorganic anion transporter [bacterium]|nr:SulP family inorganic anion transporter [bacterium]
MKESKEISNSGIKFALRSWRSDLVAGFSVSLVALPLALGVAIAAGAPPMAGLIAAIVGGLITTFIRSGKVTINGPSPALIIIIFTAIQRFDAISAKGGFSVVLAAIIIAGALMALFGLFKLGKYGNFVPSSVVQGILAAIGVIIFANQIHVGLGVEFSGGNTIESLMAIPKSLLNMNPLIAIIFVNSLFILARHPHVKSKFIKFVPAPMWVLVSSILFYKAFLSFSGGEAQILGSIHQINSDNLITLPKNIFNSISFYPDFSFLNLLEFWVLVFSIFLISTIETLLGAKGVDKLDSFKRKTNLNHDLTAVGVSTALSGALGGLPVITVISRSSVNLYHGAKSRLSSFYHGLFLVLYLFLLTDLIQMVPLAALAAILVYTGYKLASPKVFKDANLKGYEQLFILVATLVATLITSLLWGIVIGVMFTLLIHLIRSSLPATLFAKYLFAPSFKLSKIDNHYYVKPKGVVNFAGVVRLEKSLRDMPENQQVIFDFSLARIVDFSILEYVHEWGEDYQAEKNGSYVILGLDDHLTTSEHPYSIHVLPPLKQKKLSKRQKELEEMCFEKGWEFDPSLNWEITRLRENTFFTSRPIEYAKNNIRGSFDSDVIWEINDVTFDEGALMMAEVHHCSMLRIIFDQDLPNFSVEHERFFSRFLEFTDDNKLDIGHDASLSHRLSIKGKDEVAIKRLLDEDFQTFLSDEEDYHIECQDNIILIFRYMRTLTCEEIIEMIDFGDRFISRLHRSINTPMKAP